MRTQHNSSVRRSRDERIVAARGLIKVRARRGLKSSNKLQQIANERLSTEQSTARKRPVTA